MEVVKRRGKAAQNISPRNFTRQSSFEIFEIHICRMERQILKSTERNHIQSWEIQKPITTTIFPKAILLNNNSLMPKAMNSGLHGWICSNAECTGFIKH